MLLGCRPKEVVAALIKRLAHRNANVQLYTLEVQTPGSLGILSLISLLPVGELAFTKLRRQGS